MDLKKWTEKYNLSVADFAKAAGWSNIKSWRIIEGKTSPRLDDVVTIGQITNGQVTPEDMLAKIVSEKY